MTSGVISRTLKKDIFISNRFLESTNATYTQTHRHTHARTHARTHATTHVRTRAHTHTHTGTHTHIIKAITNPECNKKLTLNQIIVNNGHITDEEVISANFNVYFVHIGPNLDKARKPSIEAGIGDMQ